MLKKYIVLALTLGIGYTANAQFVNHGPQVFAAAIQGSHFVKDKTGKEYVFTVARGVPARLVGYELNTQKLIVNSELPGTDGAWDMEVSSDNIVYISGNGLMYSYTLGDKDIKNLGEVLPNQKVVWDLVAGKDGKIYGGTYPDCQVYEYDPKTGFKDLGKGAVQQGENYVRSLAFDAKTNKIYAGVGSHAGLIEMDLISNVKKQIIAEQDKDHEFMYDMELIADVKGGDRLIGWFNSAKKLETVIYNLKTGKYDKRFSTIEVKSIAKKDKSNLIYYTAAGRVFVLDFADKNLEPREIAKINGRGRAGYIDNNGHYNVITASHKVYTIDVSNGNVLKEIILDVPKAPISIQSIFWGPDNKVWSGGYLAGNHGTFDPTTGKHEDYMGLHQSEGMGSLGNKIYFGNYTHAELFSYDVTQSWNLRTGNPKFIGSIKNQDRPFAVLPVAKRNEIIFGTVPGYGQLGGAITHLNALTDKFETFEKIIPNHSIMSLIEINGRIIGGTSISGGLGVSPIEKRGRIFEWDADNKKVLWTDSIDNYWSITGLFKGPDNGIWGFADGTLVKYDIDARKVVFKKEVYNYKQFPSHIWRNGLAVSHPNGLIYFTLTDKFYSYDIKTDELKMLKDKPSLITLGKDNKVYFRMGTELWSYTPEGY